MNDVADMSPDPATLVPQLSLVLAPSSSDATWKDSINGQPSSMPPAPA
jgi:hypothetical protein